VAALFVDTNVWIRYLTRDDQAKYAAVENLLTDAEAGAHVLTTSHVALAELEWTLRSFFQRPKDDVVPALRRLLNLRSLHADRRHVLQDALSLYGRHNVDFVDAYNAADMQSRGIETVVSYDRDFDRLGVKRLAPGG
jgi:predicted nucleic-acid-binding protein